MGGNLDRTPIAPQAIIIPTQINIDPTTEYSGALIMSGGALMVCSGAKWVALG